MQVFNGGKIDIQLDANGQIVLGDNATADLVRMADMINGSGSPTAISQFNKLGDNLTEIHFSIDGINTEVDGVMLMAYHQPHDVNGNILFWKEYSDGSGKFDGEIAFINDGNGNLLYKEATITIYEKNFDLMEIGFAREYYDDYEISMSDVMVAVFSHEAEHNLNTDGIRANSDMQNGFSSNLDQEVAPVRIEAKVYEEIRRNR